MPHRETKTTGFRRSAWVGLMLGLVASLPPARAGDDAPAIGVPAPALPFEAIYVPDQTTGTVVIHPAAIAERVGTVPVVAEVIDECVDKVGEEVFRRGWFTTVPAAQMRLKFAQIETFVMGFEIKVAPITPRNPGDPAPAAASFQTGGFAVRTVAPYDWRALLEAYPLNLKELKDGDQTYFTIVVPGDAVAGQMPTPLPLAVYLPDDRTMVVESESFIRSLIRRTGPTAPSYLQGDGWARISRGLLAVAVDNSADSLIQRCERVWPEQDEVALLIERLRGVERLMVGVDAPAGGNLTLQVRGTARDEALARSVAASAGLYALLGRGALALETPENKATDLVRLIDRLCKQVQVKADGRTVDLILPEFLTRAELAAAVATPPGPSDPAVQPARLDTLPAAPPQIDPSQVRGIAPLLPPARIDRPESP